MLRTHGSFGSYARTLRAVIITVLLLACGDSSSNPAGPRGGGGGSVAQLSITPNAPTITVGAQLALQAQVRDASGNIITGAPVFWSSADTAIVTISSAGIVTGKAVGSAQIAASSGGQSARVVVTVSTAPVATVSVLPAAATLVVGGTTVLKAVMYDANQTELPGRTVVWASSATQVARVDATGNVIGVAAGTANITATSEGKTGTSTITVTVIPIAAISIAPGSAALTVGQSASLTAIATDGNGNVLGGRPMTWKSSDSTIATVSTLGLVTAIAPGSATISATAEGRTGIAQVVVTSATPTPVASVAISPATASIIVGGTATLSATLRDAAGTALSGRAVQWVSSAPAIATVSGSGVVTAVAVGTATITATSEGKSGTASVSVSNVPVASITVTPASSTLLVGGATATLTAVTRDGSGNVLSGRVVTWTSSAPTVATVSSTGVVTPVGPGNTTITATSEGQSATAAVGVSLAPVATIALTPTTASIVVGSATTIVAVLTDANGNVLSGRITGWTSNTPGVATVDANGVVTAVSAGTATITATSEGKSATATVTVSLIPVASVTPSPTGGNLYVGETLAMSAVTKDANNNVLAGRVVTWSTSTPAFVTVDAQTGVVTAVAPGTATILATSEGQTGSASIVVALAPVNTVTLSPTSVNLVAGATTTLAATLTDRAGRVLTGRTITWSTSAASVASVDPTTGLITAVAGGTAQIKATSEGVSSLGASVIVTDTVATVTLSPTSASLRQGATKAFVATPKNASGQPLGGRTITWASDAPASASVNASTGLVTGRAAGIAHIKATSEGKTSAGATVTVTDTVASVTLNSTIAALRQGATITLTATPRNAAGQPLAGRVITWASDSAAIAAVDANTGLITAVAAGTATVTATSEGKTSPGAVVTVTDTVATVTLNPGSTSLVVGATTTWTATPMNAGGQPLTGRTVTWASDSAAIASVDATTGLITANAAGIANIAATSEGKTSAPTAVTVSNVPVNSVTVTPATATLSALASETVTLTANPKDAGGNPLTLTGRTVSWSSNTPAVATVDPSTGLVTAISQGTATITATVDGVSGIATVTVNP